METMKKFVRYYKPYKTVFFLDMLCALIISVIDLAFPQILNYLNNTFYIQPKEMILNSLWILGVGLLFMYIIRALCRYYVTAQGHIMGAKMESDMRQDLFDQFERLSFSYYDRNNTGEMMSKLVSDLFDISEFAHHGPENVFISLLKILGSFILLLYIHVPLTLILIGVTILIKKCKQPSWITERKLPVSMPVYRILLPEFVWSNPLRMRTSNVISSLIAINYSYNQKPIITIEWDYSMQAITFSRVCYMLPY